MTLKIFITGTDTNVGKTYISVSLLKSFNAIGYTTLGIKPVATGCFRQHASWVNHDALLLQRNASIQLHYQHINPVAFEPAIAPHIAADLLSYELNLQTLNRMLRIGLNFPSGVTIIEGVGGWHVPLNQQETMADFVKYQQLPVILVVGMRLGCLNHALLTYSVLRHDKTNVIGWIANCIDPTMSYLHENIATLKKWLPIPCLAVVDDNKAAYQSIDVQQIIACLTK